MKKKLIGSIVVAAIAGVGVMQGSAHATGNPSQTWRFTVGPQNDVVTSGSTVRLTYQTTLGSPTQQIGVFSVGTLAGQPYWDGVALQCSQTGVQGSGWKGPYTTAYPTGSNGVFCVGGPGDAAQYGWGAAYWGFNHPN